MRRTVSLNKGKKNNYMLSVIFAAGAFISAVVGAGFASGQETVSYFVRYGNISIFGVIISAVLFGIFAYCVSYGIERMSSTDFEEYILKITGDRTSKIFGAAVRIFMAIVFVAMISGGTSLLYETYDIPVQFGAMLICVICAAVFLSGNKTVLMINSLLGVLICVSVVFVCIYILYNRETAVFADKSVNWVMSSFSYVGFNILTSGAVISALRIKTKRKCALFGIAVAVMLFVMMICMWVLMSIYSGKIYLGELPMLTLAMRAGEGITVFFSAVLFCAMVTTALSVGLGILPKKRTYLAPVLLCCVGYLASGIRFSFMVDVIYRLCGYIGNVLMLIIIINQIKYEIVRKIKKNKDKCI